MQAVGHGSILGPVDGARRTPRTPDVVVLVGSPMRLRTLCRAAAPLVGALVLSGPARAQDHAATPPSGEILAGIGIGWRQNPWHSLGQSHLRALVLMAAIRPPARHLLNVEAELGWWQEQTARFGTPPDAAAVTTHLFTVGGDLFFLPRVGRLRPRAGIGLLLAHHFDTGSYTISETMLGLSAAAGGELDLSQRLGAYALARTEGFGTATFSRVYGGLRFGLGH